MGVITKVVMKSMGNYDDNTLYTELDWVRYNGCSWVAKKETKGTPPPSSPELASDTWGLLARDGEYTGSNPEWSDVDEKPFNTLNSSDFTVTQSKELKVNFPTPPSLPFSKTSNTFTTSDDTLDIKVDAITITKDSNGTLHANVTSAGFDINSLGSVTELNNADTFPLYSSNAKTAKKTSWSNIITKITALFSKIYTSSNTLITTTTIKDTAESVNTNTSDNQIAGAKAVKTIYQSIAPLPTDAPAFSSQNSYEKGAVVTYNGGVYYCNSSSPAGSSWNSSKWTAWSTNIPIRLGVDKDGNYGYYKAGADSVTPFKTGDSKPTTVGTLTRETLGTNVKTSTSYNIGNLFPNVDFTKVTESNFAVVQTGTYSASNGYGGVATTSVACYAVMAESTLSGTAPSISYDSSSKTLSVTPPKATATGRGAMGPTTSQAAQTSSKVTATAYAACSVYFYHT